MPLMILGLMALMGVTGLAIDVGRIFVTRVELSRSLDAGALAGVQDITNMTTARTTAATYVTLNDSTAFNVVAGPDGADTTRLRVTASKRVDMVFLQLLGVPNVTVTQSAVAGPGGVPMDLVLAIDTTGSMAWSCVGNNQDGSNCKINAAKAAATSFTNALMAPSNDTLFGLVPFNFCYNSNGSQSASTRLGNCIDSDRALALTNNKSNILSGISGMSPQGYTNTCVGLIKAQEVINGPGRHTGADVHRAVVLLSDGANTAADNSTVSQCRPVYNRPTTGVKTGAVSGDCVPSEIDDPFTSTNNDYVPQNAAGGEIDSKTLDVADALKAQDVEIYVVAIGVCGAVTSNVCNRTTVGVVPRDDRGLNLLKCIASSDPGTNSHYFATSNANNLTAILQVIGGRLSTRLIE